ncbi:16S rRNA (uracil(1498)-N(3))-methyltransferase [Litorilinea aerophila]|uniref:Ribosomal RNA small subunit methyltransferase E n=1 Tax=Litorilinea aerophila TaxID=1204385 RepID=A0A540V873_9CHLR|nr:16S rRNA (uracil(1498)-N(3))-methyltransferase [Litorilinea aerophila]MCC9079063.1 16S rRNA (uracil(1498)-N(3))-methyltransferase [Litorilinea aerophila]OUC09121.1 hypothetical protein RY27_04785 [Litorilinea aerophila]
MATLHRFFLPDTPLEPGQPVDLTPIAHQLSRVLRARPGTRIVLLDGRGQEFLTEVRRLDPGEARGQILEVGPAAGEPRRPVILYQCTLKADKFEWILQKGVELGVTRFVPVIARRSVVRPAAAVLKKYPRWQRIIQEAAEQSGRGCLPELAAPLSWEEAVRTGEGLRLLPWEDATGHPGLLATLQRSGQAPPPAISLLVGPEGGLTPEEVALARSAGWQVISLGTRILRAETAALAAVAVIQAHGGELGG